MVLAVLAGICAGFAACYALARHRGDHDRGDGGLTVDEIQRLRRAELALAAASSPAAAARELGKHAMALLGAPAALVLIEGVGDTVRVEVGDTRGHSPYGPGGSARLLEDDGTPVGSIAVAPPEGGRFDQRAEQVLAALGERVSSTLHRLSLFAAVQAEQRTLADVLASSSDGILSVGPDGRVRSWNPAMERITAVAVADAVERSCCAVFKPLDEAGAPLYGAACPCRRSDSVEVLAQLPLGDDARPLWLNCAYSPMSDGGCVVVVRDVTARKQVDDEKADFLATVSHELRTPLTPIKGFLQTLLRTDTDFGDEERRHIYGVMLREEQRLERLVHQLLQATSLEHADNVVVTTHVDWGALVGAQVERARRQDPGRELIVAIEPGLPRVLADEELVSQALGNLLSNALKFSPPASDITVAVACCGDRVVTTVSDHGPGVDLLDRKRIFEKFTRLGDHLTRPQQGVGLGLYIVRRSVEAMGGTVSVDNVDGGGAAFSISFPAAVRAPRTTGGATRLRTGAAI
ncbi:MAG: ATP-binding protein [Acidimicrobiales bacterium]